MPEDNGIGGVAVAKVTYLGPDESYGFDRDGARWDFEKGKAKDVPNEIAAYVSTLNPRGLKVEGARDYGAQVFMAVVGSSKEQKGGEV